MQYIKKPIAIDAFQFGVGYIPDWFKSALKNKNAYINHDAKNVYREIKTLEDVMKARKGDYIIKGVKNEIYPCKENIFNATYEKL